MEKNTKIYLILAAIVILIIISIFWIKNDEGVSEETAKCMSDKSILYVAEGCSACKAQEQMLGDNYQYLNKIDCIEETQKCSDAQIRGTPTWIINGEKYEGVQSIEKLKELTGC